MAGPGREYSPAEKGGAAAPAPGVTAKVIAGTVAGVTGPIRQPATDPTYLDLAIEPGATFSGTLPEDYAAFLYVYVPDADAAFERAMAEGASALEPPLDTPYGDRRATVRDPFGNTWQIATYRRR